MEEAARFASILAPTDGSAYSTAAGKMAIDLALRDGARLTFVYVVDESVVDEVARATDEPEDHIVHKLMQSGERYLHYLLTLAHRCGVQAEDVLTRGTPHVEIIAEAHKRKADLIVIGYVGRRGPRRILIGSVTERVIEYADCPILIVRRKG
jgi:nucleotide-binding universal stress UspA family protein